MLFISFEKLSASDSFTSSEAQIVSFVESYPRIVINMSLQELSQACHVSAASVIRFSKKLGARGFADFKIRLAQELNNFSMNDETVSVDIPIREGSSCQEIARTFYNLSVQTLKSTFHDLDYDAIEKAASLLNSADSIHLFGRGESLVIAEDFHYKLLRLGIHSVLESLNGFQDVYSNRQNSRYKTVALVISQYCNSQHTKYIIDELMSTHTPMILLTAASNAWPYDKYADVTLRIANAESRYKMGSFASRTAFQFLLDCVFGQLFSLRYKYNSNNLEQSSRRRAAREYYYKTSLHEEEK